MNKEYKKFVVNQLYGLIVGTSKSLEENMKYIFPLIFGVNADSIIVETTKNKLTNKIPDSWIGSMKATLTVGDESYSFERDFEEEYIKDIKHPDYETDECFYETDKCYSSFKRNVELAKIEAQM